MGQLLVLASPFVVFLFVLYVFFPTTAHRMIGYFEEQAVISYTEFLDCIDSGKVENIDAPKIAKDYYKLPQTARLRDVARRRRGDRLVAVSRWSG